MRKIGLSEVTEAQIPLLGITIDQVRFNTTLSDTLGDTLSQVTDQTDIADVTEQLIWNLRWHTSEG